MNSRFVRQCMLRDEKVGIVIPPDAVLDKSVREIADSNPAVAPFLLAPPTQAPDKFSFHYIDFPPENAYLLDERRIDTGVYTFSLRDAVISTFDLPTYRDEEFYWSFVSTQQLAVVAALRIGETLDVVFEEELDRAYHITKYYFPVSVADRGYGQYLIHVTADSLTSRSFRIVSAYEPGSKRTDSRLPFFFGFRVFGSPKGAPSVPVWRDMLSEAVRSACSQQWNQALMHAAFSLEAFMDEQLGTQLRSNGMPEKFIRHIIKNDSRYRKLLELNKLSAGLGAEELGQLESRLDRQAFTPRNDLAHGRRRTSDVSSGEAAQAIRTVVGFLWDWGSEETRLSLLPRIRPFDMSSLVDEDLIEASQS